MRLIGTIEDTRLVTVKSGIDYTKQMRQWIGEKLDSLAKENICGFIFKSKSPSSGRYAVKIYGSDGIPVKKGIGLFAKAFVERFPQIPIEEEGRLNDAVLRENFIDKIIIYSRWREFSENDGSSRGLVEFHSRHKYLLMAHSPAGLSTLGRIVASLRQNSQEELHRIYLVALMETLDFKVTAKKNRNTMQHIMGYFKNELTANDKQELIELIDGYVNGELPMLAPLIMLRHYANKYGPVYLRQQYYLHPSQIELRLKYHS
jgi:uncharacterized protein YbgA (DUF1722 family)